MTPVAESEATRLDISDHARTLLAAEPAAMRNLVVHTQIDPDTQQVVLQYLDHATRQLVRQMPDEELLRLRAYVRTLFATSRSPAEQKIERSAVTGRPATAGRIAPARENAPPGDWLNLDPFSSNFRILLSIEL